MDEVFPAEEFIERRRKLSGAVGANSLLLIQSAAPVDGFTVFRQTNEFYYLVGLESPSSLLLIGNGHSALYLPFTTSNSAGEHGALCFEDAAEVKRATGVDYVYPTCSLKEHLPTSGLLFTPFSPAEGKLACQDTLLNAAKQIAGDERERVLSREGRLIRNVRELRPSLELRDLSPALSNLRLIKSRREFAFMRR